MRLFLSILLFSQMGVIWSQSGVQDSSPGRVVIHTPPAIDSLEKAMRGRDELRGYRIQVFLGSSTEAKAERNKFLNLGTGLSCSMVQNIPNYAVQVGDFRTSLEAHRWIPSVRNHYPGAFVVEGKINPPRLSRTAP